MINLIFRVPDQSTEHCAEGKRIVKGVVFPEFIAQKALAYFV